MAYTLPRSNASCNRPFPRRAWPLYGLLAIPDFLRQCFKPAEECD